MSASVTPSWGADRCHLRLDFRRVAVLASCMRILGGAGVINPRDRRDLNVTRQFTWGVAA